MTDEPVDLKRRRMLTAVTGGVGAVGAITAAVPFVASMTPSARAKAAGAPVEIDISKLKPGQMTIAEWRGKPVFVLRRTAEMLESLKTDTEMLSDPASDELQQPEYTKNEARSINPEVLVIIGICTHLGCAPTKNFEPGAASGISDDWPGGFFCPCHGSKFDLAGRVFKSVPAPTNMVVPPHKYLSDDRILVGVDPEQEEEGAQS